MVEDRGPAWAVIGAGPHGLSALKALLQLGIEADGYERAASVGGNWNFGGPSSRVYRSTHLISTKPFTQFPDFPMPDSYPDYPSHWQVHAYLQRYADHFGLTERIAFDTEVVRLEQVGERWNLTAKGAGGETTRQYAGVVLANGHNWFPKRPEYPGMAEFAGTIIHSADYKDPSVLQGKRVLVVGAGNTGCDIAVESAQHAERTWHSTRRGYYYNPKYAFGRPSDQTADLLLALRLPLAARRLAFKATLKLLVGDLRRIGLPAPDHEFFETHPIVNQQLLYYVGHGDITPAPDIDHFTRDSVVFADGSSAKVDVVVCCTGYLAVFPFLDEAVLPREQGRLVLARQMFDPEHPTLAVSGLIQPDSGQWTIAHWQGIVIATYARLLAEHPGAAADFMAEMRRVLGERYTGGAEYRDSTRHYYEIAHQDYLQALEGDLGLLQNSLALAV